MNEPITLVIMRTHWNAFWMMNTALLKFTRNTPATTNVLVRSQELEMDQLILKVVLGTGNLRQIN
jgi:hypothetical protein